MLCHLSWSQGVAQEPYCTVLDKLSLSWKNVLNALSKKDILSEPCSALLGWRAKALGTCPADAASAGITTYPWCVFPCRFWRPWGFGFFFYCLVSFVLLGQGPLQTLELKWKKKTTTSSKGSRWRTLWPGWSLGPGAFRTNSEPNQLGKPDSCAGWISGINNAIRPLLSGCSACSSYYLTSRNILEAMCYGSATAAVLQPHLKTFSVARFWHSMFVYLK